MRISKILFGLTIILAIILRFYQLGKTPISLEWDEVAIGYDAYSVLKTGRDQFGNFFPLTFRSLDDYKPPLYLYLTVPSVAVFDVTEFAVRFPSALFGVLAVILTYYLVLELFQGNKNKYALSFLSSFFLATSPWHLQFSRAAFETNISVTVTIAAVLLFLKGIKGNNKAFFMSAFFYGLALFSYHSTRVVTPLILIFLFITFKKQLPAVKNLFIFWIIYGFFIFLFLPIAWSQDSQIRFRVTNVLEIEKNQENSAKEILQDQKLGAGFAGSIFHNRRIAYLNYDNFQKIFNNYIKHFDPKFLFISGDAPLHHAPNFGMMYFYDFPLLILGVIFYILKYRQRNNLILFIWLLLSPVPASVTWQVPHAVRTEIILPTLQVFAAIGLVELLGLFKKEFNNSSVSIIPIFTVIAVYFMFSLGAYMHQYYLHTNYELSDKWLFGRKEAVTYAQKEKYRFDKVIVSSGIDMPYIFWLFYSKYNPKIYLENGGTLSGGFAEERNRFDKYEFHNFNYEDERLKVNNRELLIGIPKDFPEGIKPEKIIYYLNGSPAIYIVSN